MDKQSSSLRVCPVCGGETFKTKSVLWAELISEWELSPDEVDYVDLQQGFQCTQCKNNLRSMTLGAAITAAFGFKGSLENFFRTDEEIRRRMVLEINAAGSLSPFLSLLPKHVRHSFPEIDMQRMNFETGSVDLIIHSDTLEHVPDSRAALQECHRVLKPNGYLFYTVPVIVGRRTRTRAGLASSYHGEPDARRDDYVVQTEYGADFWCETFEAGFRDVRLTSLIFPASMAISARKI
jgi:SAM-dependent methyltransferase